MKIPDHHLAAIKALGYTEDEARFLYLVATFSGYFVPRQFLALSGANWGPRTDRLTKKLLSRGHAARREYDRTGVYHLFGKGLYTAIGKANLLNRRRHSIESIRTRLVVLDFIIAHQHFDYLENAKDKFIYFSETLGIPKAALPAKIYGRYFGSGGTRQYFADPFPVFLDGSRDRADRFVTFCHVDSGQPDVTGFRHHLETYKPLLSQLTEFRFLYVSSSTANFPSAERCFESFSRVLRDNASAELLRYFEQRTLWDSKQYGRFSNDDLEWLNQAQSRFQSLETDVLYAAWRSGELVGEAFRMQLGAVCRPRLIHFSSCLVSRGQAATNEL
jgi:hypothetical protein